MAFNFTGAAGGALGGAAAGSSFGPYGAVAGGILGGLGGSGLFGGGGGSAPSFNPQAVLDFQKSLFNQESPQALGFGKKSFTQAANQGIDFAKQGTGANITNQETVTPGLQGQRESALNQINSYIQGQIPADVQQSINRQVAQNLGGGYNLFSGGGQAPSAFARNIGQTSLGLSQYGLSAAPTWQQLANQMVVSPAVGLGAGLQATGQGIGLAQGAAGLANDVAQSQYQSQFGQYQANQLQNQQQAQFGMGLGQMGLSAYDSMNNAKYLNSLSPSMQGRLANTGGLPAATGYGAYAPAGGGYYQPGTTVYF